MKSKSYTNIRKWRKEEEEEKEEEDEQFPKLTKHIYHHARRRASFRGLFHVWL